MVLYGHLENFGWWNKGRFTHDKTLPVEQLFAEAAARRRSGEIPTSDKHLSVLWKELLEECKLGWWTEPVLLDQVEGDFVSSLYFGKKEGTDVLPKIRGILDPYPNRYDIKRETMRLDGVQGVLSTLQAADDVWSRALGKRVHLGFAEGFQTVVAPPRPVADLRYSPKALANWPHHGVFPRVIVFGPRKGPLVFSRAPLLMCHVMRELFSIPAVAHIDVIIIVEEVGPPWRSSASHPHPALRFHIHAPHRPCELRATPSARTATL